VFSTADPLGACSVGPSQLDHLTQINTDSNLPGGSQVGNEKLINHQSITTTTISNQQYHQIILF
jgi:hypothetical protein